MSVLKIKGQNGQWTDVLSIKGEKGDNGQDYVLTENDKQEIAGLVNVPVDDVQIDGTSIVADGVANIPKANSSTHGVVKVNSNYGIGRMGDGSLALMLASEGESKNGTNMYNIVAPINQHISTFYGLAKVSGDTTQSQSDNPAGTYTSEAKASIQSMLGVPSEDEVVTDVQINDTSIVTDGVANIPIANSREQIGGVVAKTPLWSGITFTDAGAYLTLPANTLIKAGTDNSHTSLINQQHLATFYGLAKAAGTDEKDSTLPVGQYTESAKSAISSMLNAPESVSGMTPTITAKAGVRYICGECTTLDITTPESGIVDITFTSGTTPTVLTVTPPTGMTMMWANGFDSTALEANTVYEINIMDGCKGVACSWT